MHSCCFYLHRPIIGVAIGSTGAKVASQHAQIDRVFTIFHFSSVCSIKTNTWLHVRHIYQYYADNSGNAVLAAA